MVEGAPPVVALNGAPFVGTLVAGTDDPLTRQAVKGAHAQLSVLTTDASVIVPGLNNLTFTKVGEK